MALDNLSANQLGLLQTGLAILGNAYGPNARNAIAIGGMQGLQALQSARENEQMQNYRKAQEGALRAKTAQIEQEAALQQNVLGLLGLGAQQQPALLAGAQQPQQGMGQMAGGGQAQQGGGGFPLSLNQVVALKAAGGPDLLEPYKFAQQGTRFEPGSIYRDASGNERYIPRVGEGILLGQDGAASTVPGYVQANAAIEGSRAGAVTRAQQAAQLPYDEQRIIAQAAADPLQVVDPETGNTNYRSRAQVLGLNQSSEGGVTNQQSGSGDTAKLSQSVIDARATLPKVEEQAMQIMNTVDRALSHPGLDGSVGLWSVLPVVPGSSRADFKAVSDQLQGQVFLQAFESLKGGGAITEVEGEQATKAIARLSTAQSPQEYRESLQELKDIVQRGRERAYRSARMDLPGSSQSAAASGSNRVPLAEIFGR